MPSEDQTRSGGSRFPSTCTARSAVVKGQAARRADLLSCPPSQHSRQYYIGHVRRLCRLADVPEVVPHSLYV